MTIRWLNSKIKQVGDTSSPAATRPKVKWREMTKSDANKPKAIVEAIKKKKSANPIVEDIKNKRFASPVVEGIKNKRFASPVVKAIKEKMDKFLKQ